MDRVYRAPYIRYCRSPLARSIQRDASSYRLNVRTHPYRVLLCNPYAYAMRVSKCPHKPLSRMYLPYFAHPQQPFEVCCRCMCHSMLIGFTYIRFMDVSYVHTWFLVFRVCVYGFFAYRVYAYGVLRIYDFVYVRLIQNTVRNISLL